LLSPEATASTEARIQNAPAVKIQTIGIIFAFGFHCKRIVAIFMGWPKAVF
jgi:hypothetical protein